MVLKYFGKRFKIILSINSLRNNRFRITLFYLLILLNTISISQGKIEDYNSHNIEATTYIFASPGQSQDQHPVDNSSLTSESFSLDQHTGGGPTGGDLYSEPTSNLVMTSVPYDQSGSFSSSSSSKNHNYNNYDHNDQYYYGTSGSGGSYQPNIKSYKTKSYRPYSSSSSSALSPYYSSSYGGKSSRYHGKKKATSSPWKVKKRHPQHFPEFLSSDSLPFFANEKFKTKSKSKSKASKSKKSKIQKLRRKSKLKFKKQYNKFNNHYLKKGKNKYLQNKNDWFDDYLSSNPPDFNPEFEYNHNHDNNYDRPYEGFHGGYGEDDDDDDDDSGENVLESSLSGLLDYPDLDLFGDVDVDAELDGDNEDDLAFGDLDDALGEETFVRPSIVDYHNGVNLAAMGFSGLNALGGFSGLGGMGLTRALFPFMGMKSLMKNGARLLIALILLPFILLFIPIPIVSSNTSTNSRNTVGATSSTGENGENEDDTSSSNTHSTGSQLAEFGRRVLSAENCLERISCEINHFNEITGMDESENQMFFRLMSFVHDFETFFPNFLVRMATGYVNSSQYDSCSRFLCHNLKSHLTP